MSLRVLAWDHPRATRPLLAASTVWAAETGGSFTVETRSLASFGDEAPAAVGHDLVLIDHPHIGSAATAQAIIPLDELLPESAIAELASDAIGLSHDSYAWRGRQWAVAVDASCQALAVQPSALAGRPPPRTWDEVLVLARSIPRRVALPLHPAHAISAFLSLLAARGAQAGETRLASRETIGWAVSVLAELAALGPQEAFGFEPPAVLERLARGELACVPLVYAYVGYPVSWRAAPRFEENGVPGSILGGVGIAVLAGSADPEAAALLAAWLASARVQRGIAGPAGGQPASRTAWAAADADPLLPAIRENIEASRVRPRDPWWPAFQRESGELLNRGLSCASDPAMLAHELEDLYHEHRRREP